jgi:hypothetical protein
MHKKPRFGDVTPKRGPATLGQGTRGPASVSALRGLIYALGLDHHRLLPTLRSDTRLPSQARAAASWWLDIPTHISASAAT